jgi:hypothetical protein
MAVGKASDLTGCDEEVPLLGVTREFDFGQFIELFDDSPDPNAPADTPTISRVVIQPNSQLASGRNAVTGEPPPVPAMLSSTRTVGSNSGGSIPLILKGPAALQVVREPEVDLFDLIEEGPGAKRALVDVEIPDAESFFKKGTIQLDGHAYEVKLEKASKDALRMGMAVTVFASPSDEKLGTVPVRLSLRFEPVKMTDSALAQVLSGKEVDSEIGKVRPVLTAPAIRELLSGSMVLTHGMSAEGQKTPLALLPPSSQTELLSDHFDVVDLAAFIADPTVMAIGGERVPVALTADGLHQLISTGRGTFQAAGHSVDLVVATGQKSIVTKSFGGSGGGMGGSLPAVKVPDRSSQEIVALARTVSDKKFFVNPYAPDKDRGVSTIPNLAQPSITDTQPSMTDKVQPRLPTGTGLAVAVFVPWKQTWTLRGFSRGNLLHTIAMAPQEQINMQVQSWERKSRSLEQSTETETDQQTDVTQTTRDTEDVFKEMVSKHDFAWQISGSIDASYSPE